ncbi:hypothetical protein [Cryobacterium sp. MLB-32]|uniref:hypothetical protein n=1 Tax=Cryobacterium sp. MLB-32 TaxID=1529318 RepID=UPI0012DFF10F|nr:hypothetical protein [Cryobacterium sp. MLB-32]
MTGLDHAESEAGSKGNSAAYLGGAVAVVGFSILTLGNASQWFDYVSGVVYLCVAGMLAYRGIQSIAQGRRSADKTPRN